MPPSPAEPADVAQRITDYLSGGGLFNPELSNHDAVRDLLIDCRDILAAQAAALSAAERERDEARAALAEAAKSLHVIGRRQGCDPGVLAVAMNLDAILGSKHG